MTSPEGQYLFSHEWEGESDRLMALSGLSPLSLHARLAVTRT